MRLPTGRAERGAPFDTFVEEEHVIRASESFKRHAGTVRALID